MLPELKNIEKSFVDKQILKGIEYPGFLQHPETDGASEPKAGI